MAWSFNLSKKFKFPAKWPYMVKLRSILNAKTMNVLAQEQGQRCINSNLYFFWLRVCGARHVFRHEIRHDDVIMTYFVRKHSQFWPYVVIWQETWISLISCNCTPFSADWDRVFTRNHWIPINFFTISSLNFYSDAKFGHHLWRHNSSDMGWNKNQLTGNLSTYFPAKLRHIRWILLLSMG